MIRRSDCRRMIKIQRSIITELHEHSGHSSRLIREIRVVSSATSQQAVPIDPFPRLSFSVALFSPLASSLSRRNYARRRVTHSSGLSEVRLKCGHARKEEADRWNKPSRAIVALFAFSRSIFHRGLRTNRLNLHVAEKPTPEGLLFVKKGETPSRHPVLSSA